MTKTAMAAFGAILLAGCAPDAWNNSQATGLNAFIDQAAVACAPLEAGPMVITRNYYPPGYIQGQYDLWLDQTSRLYYGRISPETYLLNIGNFSSNPGTLKSAQCVVSQLPPNRPSSPTGR